MHESRFPSFLRLLIIFFSRFSMSFKRFWATVCKTIRPIHIGPLSVCLSRMSVTLVYCGQTVGWIRMPLGTEVDLGPGDTLIDGDPAPPLFGEDPNFGGVNISQQRFDRSLRNFAR